MKLDYSFSIKEYEVNIGKIEYELKLTNTNDTDFSIDFESIKFYGLINQSNIFFEVYNQKNQFKAKLDFDINNELNYELNIEDIFPKSILNVYQKKLEEGKIFSIFETPIGELPFNWRSIFTNNDFYDIEPKKSKEIVRINGKDTLKEDGENLALIINEILADKEKKRMFSNLVEAFVPSIEEINIEKYVNTNYIFFKVKESFSNEEFPSWHVSDGTNNIIAIITALCFIDNDIIFIEEIDKNIHPKLISTLMYLLNDVSQSKQLFITTHNGEILRYAEINDIYLISRNKEGYSIITKPEDSEELKEFLSDEVGINELFTNDLLDLVL